MFAWLHAQGFVTPALQEARARAALAADNPSLAREFVAEVPAERSARCGQWLQLLESPPRRSAPWPRRRRPPSNRTPCWPALRDFPIPIRPPHRRCSRIAVAPGHDTGAARQAFALLCARRGVCAPARRGGGVRPASALLGRRFSGGGVRLRAALWAGNYTKALNWLSESLANQPRWRYWRARATAAVKGADSGAPLFAEIAGMRDYYGYTLTAFIRATISTCTRRWMTRTFKRRWPRSPRSSGRMRCSTATWRTRPARNGGPFWRARPSPSRCRPRASPRAGGGTRRPSRCSLRRMIGTMWRCDTLAPTRRSSRMRAN